MQLFAGLGNPGARYSGNRHNIGFMAVDAIARRWKAAPWRERFHGLCAEALVGETRVILLKPLTFMNESGNAVQASARFYKIGLESIAVFHDELDLAPQRLRVKTGGGDAGHNGLRSITAALGKEYRRVRLGIGHPGHKDMVHSYVLNDFAKADGPWVTALCEASAEQAPLLADGKDSSFQNKAILAMRAAGFDLAERI